MYIYFFFKRKGILKGLKKILFTFYLFSFVFLFNILYSNQVLDKVLLSINNKSYTLSDFQDFSDNLRRFYKSKIQSDSVLTNQMILSQFIDSKVLIEIFNEYNLTLSDSEYKFSFQKYKNKLISEALNNNFKIDSLDDLNVFLMKKNYPNFSFLEYQLKQSLMRSKLLNYFITSGTIPYPSEKELTLLYDQNKNSLFKKSKVKIGHIIIYIYPEDESNYVLLKKKENLAQSILKKLKKSWMILHYFLH